MPRIARVVVPGQPHHVTQRGVRSMRVFYSDQDRQTYLDLASEQFEAYDVKVRAWCLMTNHIHLIAVPETKEGLAEAIGQVHQRYTRMINFRQKKRGYLFQGRFHSCVMDESYFLAAVGYIELNPVRAKMCAQAWDYRWSSARFHVGLRKSDALVRRRDLLGMESHWRAYLRGGEEHADFLRKKTRTGRPCGDMAYVQHIESRTGRDLTPRKPGPRPQKPRKTQR
ncbi:MAG: transposase [Phycisphaerae bacterium]